MNFIIGWLTFYASAQRKQKGPTTKCRLTMGTLPVNLNYGIPKVILIPELVRVPPIAANFERWAAYRSVRSILWRKGFVY
jgi:hypothetical protein